MRQLPEAGRGVLLPSHGDRSPSAGLHSPQRTPSAGRHWAQGPREGTCPRLLSSRTRACLPEHAPPRQKETFVSALEGRGQDTTQHGDERAESTGPAPHGKASGAADQRRALAPPHAEGACGHGGPALGVGGERLKPTHPGTWHHCTGGRGAQMRQEAGAEARSQFSPFPEAHGTVGGGRCATRHVPALERHPAQRATGSGHWSMGMCHPAAVTWRDQHPLSEIGAKRSPQGLTYVKSATRASSQPNLFWPSSRGKLPLKTIAA